MGANNNSLGILLKAVIDQDTKAINDQIKSLSGKIDKLSEKIARLPLKYRTQNFE